MQNVINALMNTILVSIPEETVWVILTLIFLKRFDLLDRYRWRENVKWVMIPVIPTAISINIFRYILHTPKIVMFVVSGLIFYSLIIYIVKKTSFAEEEVPYLKILLYAFLSSFILCLSELIYVPILLNIITEPITFVNENISLNFLISLPGRIFQILMIIFVLNRYSNKDIRIFKNIIKNKLLLLTTVFFIMIVLIIMFIITNVLYDFGIMQNMSIIIQVIISISIVTIPTLIIFFYLLPINYLMNKLIIVRKSHQNMFEDVFDDDI